MPIWNEILQMMIAVAIVATLALPIGLVAGWIMRRNASRILPDWKPWRGPWSLFEVLVLFFAVNMFIPAIISKGFVTAPELPRLDTSVEATAALTGMPPVIADQHKKEVDRIIRTLWVGVLSLPLQLSVLVLVGRLLDPNWRFVSRDSIPSQVVLSIVAWAALTAVVHFLNLVVNALFTCLQWPRDGHPLEKLVDQPVLESTLFVFQACVAAPVIEEMIFRGVILVWVLGSRTINSMPDLPTRFRPWFVTLTGVFFAIVLKREPAIIFFSILVLALPLTLSIFRREHRTEVGAIYSSAAVFASVHSEYWPTPISLFVFGLGLGYLAVRTRGVLAPAIVHGLFNAISVVMVLRGPG